ncbi:hypothetical protein [Scytonema sp. PCC 10023]|uniref:hypothetical protein n=1 Tax=Scytonema sp. PCC 10023 TaxID=1680591 RepID=UPI0039C5D577
MGKRECVSAFPQPRLSCGTLLCAFTRWELTRLAQATFRSYGDCKGASAVSAKRTLSAKGARYANVLAQASFRTYARSVCALEKAIANLLKAQEIHPNETESIGTSLVYRN